MGLWVHEGRRSLVDFAVEVLLISLGVFVGLLANSSHESREHHALAQSTLRNFPQELGNVNIHDSQLLALYQKTLPQLDAAAR
jgi:hypothetical protein